MKSRNRKAVVLCLSIGLILMLAGCAARLVRGESPYVNIHGIKTVADAVELRLRIRNINEVPIEVAGIEFTLKLEDTELSRYDGAMQASVIASGAETLQFELAAGDAARALLGSLEKGEVPNLAYEIDGVISTADEGPLSFSGSGRIYPVPGRPGQFR